MNGDRWECDRELAIGVPGGQGGEARGWEGDHSGLASAGVL